MWSPTHVKVTVQRARKLQCKGRKGTNDVFVLIQLGKEKFQTTIKEKATDPEWYEECDLTLMGRDSDVRLVVFHRNVLGLDEFLGQTIVSLREIENFDRTFTRWYPLQGKGEKSAEKERGELEVRISFIVQRCNNTQSLNDLSIKKKKHSIKNLAATVGHQIQKLPSRTVSLKQFDPRKKLERLREKRASDPGNDIPEDGEAFEEFNGVHMRRNGSLYSSTLSLPQSAMITSSIQEAGSYEELDKDRGSISSSSTSVDSQKIPTPKLAPRKQSLQFEPKVPKNGEWVNRILMNAKESPIARSENNIFEALKADSPRVPVRKNKIDAFRNMRRHTLQLAESPDITLLSSGKKILSNHYGSELLRNNKQCTILEGIPAEVMQQFEKMNHQDLVLLAIKQQADLERQRDKISDLENYLDNLLVRVMETTPRILQKPYISPAYFR